MNKTLVEVIQELIDSNEKLCVAMENFTNKLDLDITESLAQAIKEARLEADGENYDW